MNNQFDPNLIAEIFELLCRKKNQNTHDYPTRVPLFTGTAGYDPVSVIMAFQKIDGSIALVESFWDSSHNYIESVYKVEIFPTLNGIFEKYPQFIELVTPPVSVSA